MQISFDTATVTARELTLIGVIIDMLQQQQPTASAGELAQRFSAAAATVATLPRISAPVALAPEDSPSAGLDTAAMFGDSKLPPLPAPIVEMPSGLIPATVTSHAAGAGAVATVITPPAHVQGVEIDAAGMPWDSRIHASTKTKTVKGVWKGKKGLNDAALVKRVEAELLATMALPPGGAPQATAPAPVFQQPQAAAAPVTLPPVAASAPVAAASLNTAPAPASLPPLPPLVIPQAAPTTVAELMAQAGPLMATLQMQPNALQEACTALGIPNLQALVAAQPPRPDLITAVWNKATGRG